MYKKINFCVNKSVFSSDHLVKLLTLQKGYIFVHDLESKLEPVPARSPEEIWSSERPRKRRVHILQLVSRGKKETDALIKT